MHTQLWKYIPPVCDTVEKASRRKKNIGRKSLKFNSMALVARDCTPSFSAPAEHQP